MTEPAHVEQASLDRLLEWGGSKLLRQMVRLFVENATHRMEQIDAGLSSDDLDGVERGSHSLKSSAANVGAMIVSRISAGMEDAAEKGDWDAIRTARAELGEALPAATRELERIAEELAEES